MSKITEIEMKHQNLTDAIVYSSAPTLNESVYQLRIKSLLQLASSQGYTHLIIYGDREHYSNIHFLTDMILVLKSPSHSFPGTRTNAYSWK